MIRTKEIGNSRWMLGELPAPAADAAFEGVATLDPIINSGSAGQVWTRND
jgi:hypothetical protein